MRQRVVALACAALLPLVLVLAVEAMRAAAARGAERIDFQLSQTEALLRTVAVAIEEHLDDPAKVKAKLTAARRNIASEVNSLLLLAPNGDVVASAADAPIAGGRINLADRDYFRAALATRTLALGEPVFGWVTQRALMVAALPLLDSRGEVRAVLLTTLTVEKLSNRLATSGQEGGLHHDAERAGPIAGAPLAAKAGSRVDAVARCHGAQREGRDGECGRGHG